MTCCTVAGVAMFMLAVMGMTWADDVTSDTPDVQATTKGDELVRGGLNKIARAPSFSDEDPDGYEFEIARQRNYLTLTGQVFCHEVPAPYVRLHVIEEFTNEHTYTETDFDPDSDDEQKGTWNRKTVFASVYTITNIDGSFRLLVRATAKEPRNPLILHALHTCVPQPEDGKKICYMTSRMRISTDRNAQVHSFEPGDLELTTTFEPVKKDKVTSKPICLDIAMEPVWNRTFPIVDHLDRNRMRRNNVSSAIKSFTVKRKEKAKSEDEFISAQQWLRARKVKREVTVEEELSPESDENEPHEWWLEKMYEEDLEEEQNLEGEDESPEEPFDLEEWLFSNEDEDEE